jgi:ferredoxin
VRKTLESGPTQSVKLGAGAAAAFAAERSRAALEVTFLPDGRRVGAERDATVLELAERCGLTLESGCRMGICGADPVAIVEGLEHVAPAGDDETATLARLGHGPNTRMACCARVRGPLTVALAPEDGDEVIALEAPDEYRYAKLVVRGDRIAGALMIGYGPDAAHVADAVKSGRSVAAALPDLRRGAFGALA